MRPGAAAIGARTVQAQRSWHHVPAVLLADVPRSGYGRSGPVARATWAAPRGRARTGTVSAPPGARAGRTVLVWVDASGQLAKAPPWLPSLCWATCCRAWACWPAACWAGGG